MGSPVIVLRDEQAVQLPGSALERIVIRTWNADPSHDGDPADMLANDRHIAPPRTHIEMAEQLGMFDDAGGKLIGDPAMWDLIRQRDEGQFNQTPNPVLVSGQKQTFPLEPASAHRSPALPAGPAGARRSPARPARHACWVAGYHSPQRRRGRGGRFYAALRPQPAPWIGAAGGLRRRHLAENRHLPAGAGGRRQRPHLGPGCRPAERGPAQGDDEDRPAELLIYRRKTLS